MLTLIEKKVHHFIKNKKLIQSGDTIVVGVSGGADSMMLIDFLYTYQDKYGIQLKVAHINHGLREEADRDEQHVKEWCEARHIPCFIHRCNISDLASAQKLSEEEAGRKERYDFFISLTNLNDKIATAHNANDQAETMLMHFIRGSDMKGLGGIQAKRDRIIRPILCLSRQEIESYCKYKQLTYYDDHTNFMPVYTRNKMRLQCIPYIEEHFNEGVQETLFRQGELYQEASEFIEDYADKCLQEITTWHNQRCTVQIPAILQEKTYMQKKLLYNILAKVAKAQKDIMQVHVQSCMELMAKQTGKEVHLPYDIVVKKSYDTLIIQKQVAVNGEGYHIPLVLGKNSIEALNLQIELTLCSCKTFEESKENMYTKYVDYDKIKDNLLLRTRKPLDVITLKGGKKKLKKFFIDEKIPQQQRDIMPLIVDKEEVVWIVGSRLSSKYFVVPKTNNILEIKITKQTAQEGLC
ncbi:MAG: tRNA lysidine(34) synthetase TilS [Cellulosilyticaceae bacterium]